MQFISRLVARRRPSGLIAAVFAMALLSGCATTSFHPRPPEYKGTPVTAVYVYSFLDLREGHLGPKFLAEVKRQLSEAFAQEGVRDRQLWFEESPLRAQFSLQTAGRTDFRSKTRVPVGEVIEATKEDERLFGASHRLVVFPSLVSTSTTSNMFTIRWDLVDVHSGRVVWTTVSRSNHMKWFRGDESPQERAAIFVRALMDELRKAGAVRPAPGLKKEGA